MNEYIYFQFNYISDKGNNDKKKESYWVYHEDMKEHKFEIKEHLETQEQEENHKKAMFKIKNIRIQ